VLRAAVLPALVTAFAGCATLRNTVGGYDTGPAGITRSQQRQRDALMAGDFAALLTGEEEDDLLRGLHVAIARYHASQFAQSAAVLDSAAVLADDRITASLSRGALAFVTNDMARRYQPGRTERLFMPYYAMLAYVHLGAWEDAAVEARRLVNLLALYGDDRDDAERTLHASLHHLAGAVFERAGDRGEAQVAYRGAHALLAALPDGSESRPRTADGELLVVVERGFVAHRATESIGLFIEEEDRDSLRMDGDARSRAVARIARQVTAWSERADGRSDVGRHRLTTSYRGHHRHDDDDAYYLNVALPVLRRSPRQAGGPLRLAVDDRFASGVRVAALLDDGGAADERRARVSVLMRALARAAAKYAAVKAVKDKKGEVAGELANVAAALLERADVRSWHLLPQEISLLRVRVPAGVRTVRLTVGEGLESPTVNVGIATVRAGAVTIVPVRLWRDPSSGSTPLVIAARDTVCAATPCR
jgi:hypothetical protein